MKATFLGCGDAFGMPRPACVCPQCTEARAVPAEQRTRSGMLLEVADERVLLDCSPDILRQLEAQGHDGNVQRVVISHLHPDHMLGLFDLACTRTDASAPIRVYANVSTRQTIESVFPSLLRPPVPKITFEPWGVGVRIEMGGLTVEGFETHHRDEIETTAMLLEFREADVTTRVAYASDMGERVPSPAARLHGVDLFVGDGTFLGGPAYGHPGTERVLASARELGAKRIALTHIGHWGMSAAEGRRALDAHDGGRAVAICRDGDLLYPGLLGT